MNAINKTTRKRMFFFIIFCILFLSSCLKSDTEDNRVGLSVPKPELTKESVVKPMEPHSIIAATITLQKDMTPSSLPATKVEPTPTPLLTISEATPYSPIIELEPLNIKDFQQDQLILYSKIIDDKGGYSLLLSNFYQEDIIPLSIDGLLNEKYSSWDFSSQSIAFVASKNGVDDLFVAHLPSGKVTQITFDSDKERNPSLSPGGSKLVFEKIISEKGHLFIVDLATLEIHELILPGSSWLPRWSPDGQEIAYIAGETITSRINSLKRFDIRTKESETVFTTEDAWLFNPDWSFDSQKIVFELTFAGNFDSYIYVVDRDGENLVQLSEGSDGRIPRWSSQAYEVLFTYNKSHTQECQLIIVTLDELNTPISSERIDHACIFRFDWLK